MKQCQGYASTNDVRVNAVQLVQDVKEVKSSSMVEAVWLYPYFTVFSSFSPCQRGIKFRRGYNTERVRRDTISLMMGWCIYRYLYMPLFIFRPFDFNLTYHLFHFILHRHVDLSAKRKTKGISRQIETIRCMFLHQLIIHNIYTSMLNNQKRRRSVQYQLLLGLSLLSDLFGKY